MREIPSPPSKARGSNSNSSDAASVEDDPVGPIDKGKPTKKARRKGPVRKAPANTTARSDATDDSEVETSAACAALLASLATADTTLRIEIATALGKLGDKAAVHPLERHMVDHDVRVRRAVASALVQLGHPKGEALLDVAERTPAAELLAAQISQPKRARGNFKLDGAVLKKVGIAVVVCAVLVGGIGIFMQSGAGASTSRGRKPKKKKTAAVQIAPGALAVSPFLVG